MTQIKNISFALLALLLISVPLSAQDNRTLDTKVADLLVQIPADNEQDLNEQMELMLQLGESGQQKILDLVIPPGTGDDIQARMAVESLSRYVSQPGREQERSRWETMILKEIESENESYVKSFLMAQLYYIGSEASVEVLSKYLGDAQLHDPAIRVLRDAIPGKAADLFARHLENSKGEVTIALVNAMKETGNSEHAPAVARLAGSDSPELQRSVLACLAVFGHPDSYKLLNAAASAAGYLPEPTNATGSLLAYAETMSVQENSELSLKICKTVDKHCKTAEQLHFKCKALATGAGNYSIEEAIPYLAKALQSENKIYRMAAINYAATHNSPVEPWYPILESAKSKDVKIEILYLFGELNRKRTANLVTSYLKDPDPLVREQALKSLALIRRNEAVPHIVKHLRDYPSPPDTDAAKAALLQGVNKELIPMLVYQLNDAPVGAKVVLIEVIAEKREPAYFQTIYDQIGVSGEVRTVSMANLFKVSSHEHLEVLMQLFDPLENQEEQIHIEKALVEAINSSPDKAASTLALLAHASEKSNTSKYIGVLATVGGKEALDAVYSEYLSGAEPAKVRAMEGLLQSDDIFAATAMFEICLSHPEESIRAEAFSNYVRVVTGSSLPDDQKLLMLRKIESHAASRRNTTSLIRAMGGVKTFLSLVTLSTYLEDESVQSQAANALVRVALPSDGQDNGLKGDLVREKLMRAKEIISGPDSEYLQIDIENYLDGMPEQAGFVSMFNGKDLSGWQGLAADPKQKEGLSTKELQVLQDTANAKLMENWSVKDHCIVFNGDGSNLCSVKEYGDFEMIVDWRITKKGDSGIYLRASPQVQIWDTSRVDAGAQVGSGGLYNNQVHESKPLLVADNPVGDWNTFRITMIGEKVTVYLNGQLVADHVVMENYWDRSIPIYPQGSIELQAHGTDLAFRDIYVRELEPPANVLSKEEAADGFVSLFNGKDLSGWTGENHSYAVEDGTIVIRPTEGGGNLYTEKEYSDFIFRFEFKLTPGANNGLGIRAPLQGNAAYLGYELQILDNDAPVYAELQAYQYHGSVYGIIPALRGYQKPVGEWNKQEVWVRGDLIRITLNGTVILEGDLKEASKDGTPDGMEHPGLERTTGHIGFLGHGSLLWFRNIRIKEL
jgi:HEAT repeat protein